MQLITENEHIFSVTFHPDGTSTTSVIRHASEPSEDDRAWADAIRIADSFATTIGQQVPGRALAHFEAHARSFSPAFRELVLKAFLQEVEQRTVPGTDPRPTR